MNLLRFRLAAPIVTALLLIPASFAQAIGGDKVDLDALGQIKTEAFQHSQVMDNLFWMSEVYGPRITNSANHKLAAEWAMKQMKEWGLRSVHLEKWPFGYGWQIKHFYAAMETPVYAAFTGFRWHGRLGQTAQSRSSRCGRRSTRKQTSLNTMAS